MTIYVIRIIVNENSVIGNIDVFYILSTNILLDNWQNLLSYFTVKSLHAKEEEKLHTIYVLFENTHVHFV